MTAITFANLGGVLPSVSPRALPGESAQIAHNLFAGTSEFRPLADDTPLATSLVANPQTLWRMTRKPDGSPNSDLSTGWLSSIYPLQIVKGQVADQATERTYMTIVDGVTRPYAIDIAGVPRILGVPAPTLAPTVTVVVSDEFTPTERSDALDAASLAARDAFTKNTTVAWLGAPRPGTTTPGYLDPYEFSIVHQDAAKVLRIFRLSSTGGANNGTITHTYSALTPQEVGWVFDPALGGFFGTAGPAHPSWTGNTHDHWCIPLTVYGATHALTAAPSAALMAVQRPNSPPGTSLFTSDQVTAITAQAQALISPAGAAVKPTLDALVAKAADVRQMLDQGSSKVSATAVAGFYTTVAQPKITDAVNDLAEKIWSAVYLIATTNALVPADLGGSP